MSNLVDRRCESQSGRIPALVLGKSDADSVSAAALACSALGANAAGARANDLVAAANGTGDAHEDTPERYCHPI